MLATEASGGIHATVKAEDTTANFEHTDSGAYTDITVDARKKVGATYTSVNQTGRFSDDDKAYAFPGDGVYVTCPGYEATIKNPEAEKILRRRASRQIGGKLVAEAQRKHDLAQTIAKRHNIPNETK